MRRPSEQHQRDVARRRTRCQGRQRDDAASQRLWRRTDDECQVGTALVHHLLDHLELHWNADPTALVFGNIGQLSEVFLNLFLNAVYAMAMAGAGAGRLSINTVNAGARVQVVVSDTGPRISDAVLARLFEPFFTTKPTGEGTGLGLVISNEIVIEHGGTLTAHRTSSDGASFCVELPRGKP